VWVTKGDLRNLYTSPGIIRMDRASSTNGSEEEVIYAIVSKKKDAIRKMTM
jgi:hypothetical protein